MSNTNNTMASLDSDVYTEEEIAAMTPERRRAVTVLARIDAVAERYHQALSELVSKAMAMGLVLTVHEESLKPLAMGNIGLKSEVRPCLKLAREIMALEEEARISELSDEEKSKARGDVCTTPPNSATSG